jgi:hypothetical protein
VPLRRVDRGDGKPYNEPGLPGGPSLPCRKVQDEIACDALAFHVRPQAGILFMHNVAIPGSADNKLGL